MKNILLTGANGVLGTELLCQMPSQAKIVAVSTDPITLSANHERLPNLKCFSWDELDDINWDQIDVVVHCAFSRTQKGEELSRSLDLTRRLLQKVGSCTHPIAYVGLSSRSVYGQNPLTPLGEDSTTMPTDMYAMAKVGQEQLTQQAAEQYGFAYTSLRLAGLIGVGMDARLVSKLVVQTIQKRCLNVVGGEQQFAMLDVRDAAAGILALLKTDPAKWEPVYNLGSSRVYTLRQIAELIQETAWRVYGRKVHLIIEHRNVKLIDCMDCSRFYSATGWKPQYQLADTVEMLFRYYSAQ